MSAILPITGFIGLIGLLLVKGSKKAKADQPAPKQLPEAVAPDAEQLTSPWPGISAPAWSKFVRLLARGEEGTITPTARYGLFLFGVRRLADLGLVTNVRRGQYQGRTVWTGDWVPPYSSVSFLTSSRIQYRTFVKSMANYTKKFTAAKAQNPGLFNLDGAPLSLSGFLALAHITGFRGAIDFLRSGRRLPSTMALVQQANGLF